MFRNNSRCLCAASLRSIRLVSVAPHRELIEVPVECYRCKSVVRTIKILAIMAAGRDKLATICSACRKSAPAQRQGCRLGTRSANKNPQGRLQ